ncbi:hypothetical protein O3G_MSEX001963 [Manduca sexta]|uniref:FLYWCH-type domain-containing protein n=1 Tax=Manduca sexta TaxID=7130 RepID=A0A922CD20_MANSE|nr:hypothetical protein O3G_MSEX001963 [Manduca sexta]
MCRRTEKPMVTFVKSKRGKTLLKLDGYTFYSKVVNGPKTRWVCSTHNNKGCRATVYTCDNKIIKMKNEHQHATQQNTIDGQKPVFVYKERAFWKIVDEKAPS